ncbi:MAG: hypothetical protein AB1Z98_27710 [Nannocystaceae bacterium]
MPKTVVEQQLELEFGDEWDVVLKWDDTTPYRKGIHKLQGSKAVDIVAYSRSRQTLLMVELKDLRGSRIENKPRIADGALFDEVGLKVRDTVAGIRGAARTQAHADVSAIAAQIASQTQLTVVLWLEEDHDAVVSPKVEGGRRKSRSSMMTQQLKTRVRWLTCRALVGGRRSSALELHGITVRTRPWSGPLA